MSSIVSSLFEIILIPPCCNTFHWSFHFELSENRTLLKDSLIFYCPKCSIPYPNIRKIFSSMGILNFKLNAINEKLEKSKKSGLLICIQTPSSSYKFLRTLLEKQIKMGNIIEFELKTALVVSATLGEKVIKWNQRGIFLDGLVFLCKKCQRCSNYDSSMLEVGKVSCPFCNNSQKIIKKDFRELMSEYQKFKEAISVANSDKILVVPFAPNWKPF